MLMCKTNYISVMLFFRYNNFFNILKFTQTTLFGNPEFTRTRTTCDIIILSVPHTL